MDDKIIIRSVCKIPKAYLTPCKNPKTHKYADSVRPVDKDGNMILSREDKDSGKQFISETDIIEVYDGLVFDLTDQTDKDRWEAIMYHTCIAKARDERDENGDLVIDGSQHKYGTAEWYVEVPGRETANKNKNRRLKVTAQNYVLEDTPHERRQKAKVLGRPVRNVHDQDIEDYLMGEAEKNPQRIIDLYTSGDIALRLLLIEAKDKHIISYRDKMFMYGDEILGTTDESVVSYMKQPSNKNVLTLIKRETFPEAFAQEEVIAPGSEDKGETPKRKTK